MGGAFWLSHTCAKLGKHLHRVIKSLLAKEVEAVQILDVINLLLLVSIRVILHLLAKERKADGHPTAPHYKSCVAGIR